MSKLNDQMNARNGKNRHVGDFHALCLAQIVNLAVKDAFDLLKNLFSPLSCRHWSMICQTPRLFQINDKDCETKCNNLSLDVETRWSSTFNMITSAYKEKRVFNSMTLYSLDLKQFTISDAKWEASKTVCDFLHKAASLAEWQSDTSYSSLSRPINWF